MSAAAKAPATTEKKGEKGPIKAMFGKWLKFPTGRYVGLSSGFKVRRILAPKSVASRKGKFGPRHGLAREVIREVVGYAPYEMRLIEFLRNGLDKKALRLAKKRLGTHQRAKAKREEMTRVLTAQNLAKAKAAAEAKEAKKH